MAALSMVKLAVEFWADQAKFERNHVHAWFVWSVGRPADEPIIAPTLSFGGHGDAPKQGEPLAIPILKGRASVFPMGITIGRTENNDVVLRHEQVSRFHAYVQLTAEGLSLVDADSKNGTWVNGMQLVPTRPQPLPPTALIKFGELQVRFYTAESFIEYLRNP